MRQVTKMNYTEIIQGFILNLENLENRLFLQKSQVKPVIIREFSLVFIQVKEKSAKIIVF